MNTHCPYCGWPDADPFTVVSRHRTPEGITEWRRCGCGSLQVWVDSHIVTRSRPITPQSPSVR